MVEVFVDADACPVKPEVYRVAHRYGLPVILVSNARMRIPDHPLLKLVVVDDSFDASDDWIVEHLSRNGVVVTADIPLAARCLKKTDFVLAPDGRIFTEESIGDTLASRELLSHLRELGTITGGPAPFSRRDRSRFLERLDQVLQAARRAQEREAPPPA